MKVELDKRYPMPGAAEHAWAVLRDVEQVAGCMPGAQITERIDDRHFKGSVAVRLGPANLAFRGEIEVLELDEAARTMRLVGKGTDGGGGSGASMDLRARVEAGDAAACELVGRAEVSVSGKAATFGARLMGPVSEQVLQQFAANFAARVQALQASAASPEVPTAPAPAPAAAPVNAFALAWAILRDWLRSLFGTRKA